MLKRVEEGNKKLMKNILLLTVFCFSTYYLNAQEYTFKSGVRNKEFIAWKKSELIFTDSIVKITWNIKNPVIISYKLFNVVKKGTDEFPIIQFRMTPIDVVTDKVFRGHFKRTKKKDYFVYTSRDNFTDEIEEIIIELKPKKK